jgi:ABC-type sugar transport system substrate-binding protein
MLRIFISYHQRKSAKQAKHLHSLLQSKFPLARVFSDDQILVGDTVTEELARALFSANVYICLIDDEWEFRIWHPASYVRRELEVATLNPNKNHLLPLVIGANVDISRLPTVELPSTLGKILEKKFEAFSPTPSGLKKLENRLEGFWNQAASENHLPILFISSAINVSPDESLEYFSLIASHLAFALQRDGRTLPVDVVLKVPKPTDPAESQLDIIRDLQVNADRYLAVIISPYETKRLALELARFRKNTPTVPVFLLDKCLADSCDAFRTCKEFLPPGVMNDWDHGGRLAARSLFSHFQIMQFKNPCIGIVEGLEGSEERVQGFRDEMRLRKGSSVKIQCLKGGDFQRARARTLTTEFLAERKPGAVHGFFCTNDEMALGTWDSVRAWEQKHRVYSSGVRVVGYDGIRDLKGLILKQEPDPILLNSVDVDIRGQVSQLAAIVFETLLTPSGFDPPTRIVKIKGTLVLELEKQRTRSEADLKQFTRKDPTLLKQLQA